MAPDRVNDTNVLWFVQDHERRVQHLEERTEDLNVIGVEVKRCAENIHGLRGSVEGIRLTFNAYATKEDVDSLRKALYTFALSVAASAVIFAITLLTVYR